jgi:hypothetical protein
MPRGLDRKVRALQTSGSHSRRLKAVVAVAQKKYLATLSCRFVPLPTGELNGVLGRRLDLGSSGETRPGSSPGFRIAVLQIA